LIGGGVIRGRLLIGGGVIRGRLLYSKLQFKFSH
jgi:hypothetical protein